MKKESNSKPTTAMAPMYMDTRPADRRPFVKQLNTRKPEEARFYSREDIGKLLELFCFRFSGSLEFFKFFPPLDNFNELKAVDSLFPENSR